MHHLKIIFWNEQEARLRAVWRFIIQLLLNLVLFFALIYAGAAFGLTGESSIGSAVLMSAGALGITLLSIWLALRFLDHREWRDIGMAVRDKDWWADFGFGILVGAVVPVIGVLLGQAFGFVRIRLDPTSGLPGLPLIVGLLIGVLAYLCIGLFEETARAYQMRNIFEGTGKLGWLGAMLAAMVAGSLVSVFMHAGNLYFLLYVFIATLIHGLTFFLTRRAALAIAHHVALDYTLIAVLGVGLGEVDAANPAIWRTELTSTADAVAGGLSVTPPIFIGMVVMELIGLALILAWARWRYGPTNLKENLTHRFWKYTR